MKKQGFTLPGFAGGALAAITIAASLITLPAAAQANPIPLKGTAGNAVIRNSGTVTYKDAQNVAQPVQYFGVDVKVLTVAAAPTVTFDAPGVTDGLNATHTYNVTVRTNSNGPGTFSFSAGDQSPVNMALSGTTAAASTATLNLGSTIYDPSNTFAATGALVAGNTLTIKVPHDGTQAGSATDVNGLTSSNGGSTVYVTDGAGNYYGPFTVSAVSLPALPALDTNSAIQAVPTASITLTAAGNIASFTPATGWMIVEQKTAQVTVTQGQVADASKDASWDTKADAVMTTGVGANQGGTATVTTSAHQVQLTVKKYSRNTAGAPCATGLQVNFQGNHYCDAGVTGKPTDTLEYLIVVSNAGTGIATTVKATDVVPLYTTLVSTGNDFAAIYDSTFNTVDAGTGSATIGYGTLTGTSMAFDLGNPAAKGSGGTIPKATDAANPTKWYVRYQVTIN